MTTDTVTATRSTQLMEVIESLHNRRDGLARELEATGAEYSEAQSGLIDGTHAAADAVESQSKRAALVEAVAAIEARIAATQSELEAARIAETRADVVGRMGALAIDGEEHLQTVLRIRREASQALEPFIEKMVSEFLQLRKCRYEFIKIGETVADRFATQREYVLEKFPDKLARADELIEEIAREGVSLNAVTIPFAGQSIADQSLPFGYAWESSGAFGGVVHTAFIEALARKDAALLREVNSGTA